MTQGSGSKPHVPDDKTRATVEAMSSYGIPHEDIAKVIGIDDKTLRKHYRTELDTACAKANSQVAQRLYKKCMEGDTSSMIFWLKTRARWAETVKQEITGKDGDAIKVESSDVTQKVLAALPQDKLESLLSEKPQDNA